MVDLIFDVLKYMVIGILLLITIVLILKAGVDATVFTFKDHACKNTYAQTEQYVKCKEIGVEQFIQRIRVE